MQHTLRCSLDQDQGITLAGDDSARTAIALQGQQGRSMDGGKSDRMPAPPLADRGANTRTALQTVDHRLHYAGRYLRHVSQGDDPAAGSGSGGHTAGDAGTHALLRARIGDDLQTLGREQARKLAAIVADHGNAVWQHRAQDPATGHGHGRTVGQRVQQLVATEARTLPRGQQDTGTGGPHVATRSAMLFTAAPLRKAVSSAMMDRAISGAA